ncbi:MAG: thioesterase family protein [Prevotella sp.]|nr:thioesterase family protein [Prevotella sp.]
MEIGIKGYQEILVTPEKSARKIKSGTLEVFATPAMIALVEETAWKSVKDYLEPGQATVGTLLNISHLSPTPIGMKVRCETLLTNLDGRRLIFEVNIYDEKDLIGKGVHERFIIGEEKFQAKANSKLSESK